MTQVGQTISKDQFNKLYSIGTTVSADQFNRKYGTPKDKGVVGTASDVARNVGLGVIPESIGAVTSAPSILGNAFDVVTGKKTRQQASSDVQQNMNNNAFLRQGAGDQFTQNPAKYTSDVVNNVGTPSDVAGSLMVAKAPLGAAKNVATKLPEIISNAPKLATKKGTYSLMQQAVEGKTMDWNQIANTARDAAKNKSRVVRNELEKLLSEETPPAGKTVPENLATKTPAQYISEPQPYSAQTALEKRGELGGRIKKDVFGRFVNPNATSEEEQAARILRDTLSKELKRVAPGIKTPDYVYTKWAQAHGDIPTWAKRIAVGYVGGQIGKALGGNVGGPIGEILGGIVGNSMR